MCLLFCEISNNANWNTTDELENHEKNTHIRFWIWFVKESGAFNVEFPLNFPVAFFNHLCHLHSRTKGIENCDYFNLDIYQNCCWWFGEIMLISKISSFVVFSAAHVRNQHGIKVISNTLYTWHARVYVNTMKFKALCCFGNFFYS